MSTSTTTMTSKGQITLTKVIRDRLVLKKGDRLRISVGKDGSLTLRREQELGEIGVARGARTTYTFDRALRNAEGFTQL